MLMLRNMKKKKRFWTTYPNRADSLSHTWKATAGSKLYCKCQESCRVSEVCLSWRSITTTIMLVLQNKGIGMTVINCWLFCLLITAYLSPTIQYLQFFKRLVIFYIGRRENKMDMQMKGDTPESKCWHRDLHVSKIFAYFCFQMPIFRHCVFLFQHRLTCSITEFTENHRATTQGKVILATIH